MIKPPPKFRIPGREIPIGPVPLVVGTLSSIPTGPPTLGQEIPCDVVEIRVDGMPAEADWLAQGQLIESSGTPVLVTIRIKSEGGKWEGSDKDRLEPLARALCHLSAVDVEFKSEIARSVVQLANETGKTCIVSYHDFERTPPLADLHAVIEQAGAFAPVIKISTTINGEQDMVTLRSLLSRDWGVPICVIGMGPLGTRTRVEFAALGSCLAYGYWYEKNAPGQLSAADLTQQLRKLHPGYNEHFLARKRQLV
jgi:3-dehydroquinate dehydratase-1